MSLLNQSSNTNSVSFTKAKKCLETWKKLNEKGLDSLSLQTLGEPSPDLDQAIADLNEAFEVLYEEFKIISSDSEMSEAGEVKNEENLPENIKLLKICVIMYEQELAVKNCIQRIVSQEGFATQQHLSGCIALWKHESYIDEDIVEQVMQL